MRDAENMAEAYIVYTRAIDSKCRIIAETERNTHGPHTDSDSNAKRKTKWIWERSNVATEKDT